MHRTIALIASLVALAVALSLPGVYLFLGFQYHIATAQTEVEINERILTKMINFNPTLWRFEQHRLLDVLARRPYDHQPQIRRILATNGEVIAESADKLLPPILTRRSPLLDAGNVVGELEISHSLRPLMLNTLLVSLLSSALGLVVYISLKILPLRALQRTTQDMLHAQAQTLLLEQEKNTADKANRLKSEFMAMMSHEIRSPMNGILAMTESLHGHESNPEQLARLSILHSSTQMLLDIVNNILDFSKIEADKLALDDTPFDLNPLLANSVALFKEQCTKKQIQLNLYTDVFLTELRGDPFRLNQVLVNLLGNAYKFTQHGSVTLEVRLEQESETESTIRFTVHDTGIGIAPERLDSIFTAFEQEDNSTTRNFGGTGLGLSISSQLVNLMGGKLEVRSEKGQGSHFSFLVSFKRTQNSSRSLAHQMNAAGHISAPDLSGLRILLAEDNRLNQLVAMDFLKETHCELTCVENGLLALEAYQNTTFDLILMDMHMPVLDGVSATQAIRAQELASGQHLPIVALTASAVQGDRERYIAAGADDYLSKPYTKTALQQMIVKWRNPQVNTEPSTLPDSLPSTPSSATPSATDANILNAEYLLHTFDLKEAKNRAFFQDLIGVYASSGQELLEQLATAAHTYDVHGFKEAAHSFKSASANMGATQVAACCLKLEMMDDVQNNTEVAASLTALHAVFAATLIELRTLLSA